MKSLIIDTETRGLIPELGQTAFALGMADTEGDSPRVTIYDLRSRNDVELALSRLRDAQQIIGHNIKFDMRQLVRTLDLPLDFFASKHIIDTLVLSKHLIPHQVNNGGYGLKTLTKGLNATLPAHTDPKKWLRKSNPLPRPKKGPDGKIANQEEREEAKRCRTDFSLLPPEILVPYLSSDIFRTWALYRQCERLLGSSTPEAKENLCVEESLIPHILAIEAKGIPISAAQLDLVEEAMKVQYAEVKRALPFDFLSRTALLEHFGDALKAGKFETPAGGVSADRDALQFLASRSVPWASEVIQARSYHKMLTTYIKSWRRFESLGRLYPSYNIVGPRTGRMSSDSPNIQNIPKDLMRRVIVPEEGQWLVLADFSQMELRAAANMSKDQALLKALEGDVHTETARYLFSTQTPSIEDRKAAKTLNFAVLYGARAKKIRRTLSMETGRIWKLEEAQKVYERFWELYPVFGAWSASIQRFAQQRISIPDPFGRRQFPDIFRPYSLTNYLIQGFCAGIFKRALLRAMESGVDCRLLVHDEIGAMAQPAQAVEVGRALKSSMENVGGFRFPVELQVCKNNWFEKSPLEIQ